MGRLGRLTMGCGFAIALAATGAAASPWAEVGDGQLRSDIEILAAAGVIDNITMQWPLPWASIATHLGDRRALAGQPAFVLAAAARVLRASQSQMQFGALRASATLDATNDPSVVHGFDGLAREMGEGQVSAEYVGQTTAIRLSLGADLQNHTNKAIFKPDGSYVAQKIGGAVVYAGYLTHWWGPGWISALSLSNNARPFPQIGIARDETDAFSSPWLSWLGPWQAEFFVGLLDGPRVARNTIYVGARVEANPLPNLEIGLSRTTEMCGTGHRCVPLADYFGTATQSPTQPDYTNDEAVADIRYSRVVGGWPVEIYTQVMNEDNGPFVQSASSHLFGASVWLPVAANPLRLTFEYTDSLATRNIFSFGNIDHGTTYNNFDYVDGMRYRGRTLGFSLDGDSRLATLQASWLDQDDWSYELSYHHAAISDPLNPSVNVVTTAPVRVNLGEARVAFPFRDLRIELAGRLQDDQPRPYHGFEASIEAAITYTF
ncbi:MAG TPA: capsule assembly Wzi family protein [Rhizomicrobium sp.]|jgi:hypothetical protein|nr:capsule assembly Wzi family protein [Rhizomicrobium sp.]